MNAAKIKCPICKKPTQQKWLPFCSKRCADADLGHWLANDYAIPGEKAPADAIDRSAED